MFWRCLPTISLSIALFSVPNLEVLNLRSIKAWLSVTLKLQKDAIPSNVVSV